MVRGGSIHARCLAVLGLVGACGDNQRNPQNEVGDAATIDVAPDAPPDSVGDAAPDAFQIDAPTDVIASDGTSVDAVNVMWSPVQGATSYRVWRDGVPLATVAATAYD